MTTTLDPQLTIITLLAVIALMAVVGFGVYQTFKKTKQNLKIQLQDKDKQLELKDEAFKKYQPIIDVEAAAGEIKKQADQYAAEKLKEIELAKQKIRELKEKAENRLHEAALIANQVEADAKKNALEIAGEAWEVKEKAEHYTATVKAMKNIIKGYGDEYIIPNRSLLDDLAEEYGHKEAGQDLARSRTLIKAMIKNGDAAVCDYVEEHRRTTAINFVLDAFNGKIASIMAKVKHDNYGKLKQQIKDAFVLVNHNGEAFRDARIKQRYYESILEQLDHAVKLHELKRQEQEEQRKIKEQMREEERARREFEKAIKDAEKEEKLLQQAMAKARKELEGATEEQKVKYELQLQELKDKLAETEAKNQRALSMAQQTRRGHVYVISNVGSFGEDIYKIGMTRRLEPFDRVKELGDASVPFSFDVHAMLYVEDSPSLEKHLHKIFAENQVNKVNSRKEFFKADITAIKQVVDEMGIESKWTMAAEAKEYRESLALASANISELTN